MKQPDKDLSVNQHLDIELRTRVFETKIRQLNREELIKFAVKQYRITLHITKHMAVLRNTINEIKSKLK